MGEEGSPDLPNFSFFINAGTNIYAGQVITYDPEEDEITPAEVLDLYEIVDEREYLDFESEETACNLTPDPSVIITNDIVRRMMVDSYRKMSEEKSPENVFYDSNSESKI